MSLLSPQCIVTGLYVMIAYVFLPWGLHQSISRLRPPAAKSGSTVLLVLVVLDVFGLYIGDQVLIRSLVGGLLAVALQGIFLSSTDRRDLALATPDNPTLLPFTLGGLAATVLCCLHFATFVFPYIPYYYAGGRPIRVYAIPAFDSKSVLDDVFIDRKDRPSLNPDLPTYKMTLLYETSDDYYFLSKRNGSITLDEETRNVFVGTVVTRVRRSVVSRLDYSTPATLDLKEVFK
jgi:hypothetical protein